MNVSFAKENARAKVHLLQSGPETIHWGYWDGSLAPVLNVNSGERVTSKACRAIPSGCRRHRGGSRSCQNCEDIHQR